MKQREVIYFDCSNNSKDSRYLLQYHLHNAGWHIHSVTNLKEVKQVLKKYKCYVGILQVPVHLDSACYPSLYHLGQAEPRIQWIALLHSQSMDNKDLCETIFTYCYDYHTFPINLNRLLIILGHAYGMAALNDMVAKTPHMDVESPSLLGKSVAMRQVDHDITRFAAVDAPVLISGESGTGKELAAHTIHARSGRANNPFVAVNCGALPAALIQSELFGHEKGAFTGADKRKIGRFEAAHGGTLFLDEIGDLPLELQVNLLRVLEQGRIERLGSLIPIEVDVRIITATHMDLPRAVAKGRFREDLYYRLDVLHLELPLLREREEDIELLARFFLVKYRDEMRRPVIDFSSQALRAMHCYTWPGNVRELMNRIRRAIAMCDTRLITPEDLNLRDCAERSKIMPLEEARAAAEREVIEASLRYTSNNVAEAARKLKVSRGTLYKLMEKLDINVRRLLDIDEDNDEAIA